MSVGGGGSFGSLGLNNETNYSSPVQVGSPTNWKLLISGGPEKLHTLAIRG
jgi:hypothetical protein